MLANSRWHVWTTQQHVGRLLATNRTSILAKNSRDSTQNWIVSENFHSAYILSHSSTFLLSCLCNFWKAPFPPFCKSSHYFWPGLSDLSVAFKLANCIILKTIWKFLLLKSRVLWPFPSSPRRKKWKLVTVANIGIRDEEWIFVFRRRYACA